MNLVLPSARMRERKKRGPGRPGFGITNPEDGGKTYLIRAPEDLLEKMKARAEREGITASEAWRRAAREYLGLGPDAYEKYLEAKQEE